MSSCLISQLRLFILYQLTCLVLTARSGCVFIEHSPVFVAQRQVFFFFFFLCNQTFLGRLAVMCHIRQQLKGKSETTNLSGCGSNSPIPSVSSKVKMFCQAVSSAHQVIIHPLSLHLQRRA